MEVTQVRYGPTFRDPKTQSKLLGKDPLAAHVGTCGALYDLAGTDGRTGRTTDGRTDGRGGRRPTDGRLQHVGSPCVPVRGPFGV